ncbi:hypothetical protein [Streptomyces fradiae]|uniref:hypothetical protein n=1 Tax=Streptomyces fradiae TaxID=1906 RepID=UPI003512FCEB
MRFTRETGILLATGVILLAGTSAGTAAAEVIEPFGKRYEATLYGDFTTAGPDSRRVVIPQGATVAYARLFWGGNDGTYTGPGGIRSARCDSSGAEATAPPGDPATTAPRLAVGATGTPAPVPIDSTVTDPAGVEGPHHYTGESDVTDAFAGAAGDIPVAVDGIWTPAGKGCAAGWSLTVVYSFPAPGAGVERRHVAVYGGHVIQRPGAPATTVTVDGFRRAEGTARAARGAEPVDLPAAAIPPGATSAELTFAPGTATYVPSALTLSVPVPVQDRTREDPKPRRKPTPTPTPSATAPTTSPSPPPAGPHAMAETGGAGERLWLLGALGVALAATGAVAMAAVRGGRDH